MILLTILLQMFLNFVPDLTLDHLFDKLLVWFVYFHDSSLFFQQPSELLREHIPPKVKALRGRECLGDCLRELGRVGGRQHNLYNERRAYKVDFCK